MSVGNHCNFRQALDDFSLARPDRRSRRENAPSDFHSQQHRQPLSAQESRPRPCRIARQALDGPAGHATPSCEPKLLCQLPWPSPTSAASMISSRLSPGHRRPARTKDSTVHPRLGRHMGTMALRRVTLDEAESALNEDAVSFETRHLTASANILGGLAHARARRGDFQRCRATL